MAKPAQENGKAQKAFLNKVETAFLNIKKVGGKPTIEVIRGVVGGSYSTLCPAVRTVRAKLEGERHQSEALPEMPDDMKEIFNAAWQNLYRLAEANSVAAQKSFAADLERKNTEISEREGFIKDLETEVEDMEAETINIRQSAHDAQLEASEQRLLRQEAENELSIINAKLEERDLILSRLLPTPETPEPRADEAFKQNGK